MPSLKNGFLFIFLFLSLSGFCKDGKTIYYNEDFFITKKETAAYYIIIDPEAQKDRIYKYYYISGELYWKGEKSYVDFKMPENDINEGLCISYYKNGNKEEEINFMHNKKNGEYIAYYENGNKKYEEEYLHSKIEGFSKSYYENGKIKDKRYFEEGVHVGTDTSWYDTGELGGTRFYRDGKKHGEELKWHRNGKLKEKGSYKNDKAEGKHYTYYDNDSLKSLVHYYNGKLDGTVMTWWETGKVKRNDRFEDDSLMEGKCYDIKGNEIAHFDYKIMPEFPGGEGKLMVFISHNIKYPVSALENEIQGKVVVAFIVDQNGKLKDISLYKSLYPSTDKEAIRVVKLLPAWTPGKLDGELVDVSYHLPIRFTLH